jgi:FkbM family methyltransferase
MLSASLLSLDYLRDTERTSLEDSIRARTRTAYLGNGRALCRVLGRYKFFVHTSDVGFGSHILLDGFWEIWLTQFIARHVKPGQVVMDIGANFGYYTVLLADLVGESGRCFAIEPNPTVATDLESTVAINGFAARTSISRTAAGDRTGATARLHIPEREPKNARVVGDSWNPGRAAGAVTQVPTSTVDELVENVRHVDFIKVDVEGAEAAVIRGMSRLLARGPPDMILEFNAARCDAEQFLQEILRHYPRLHHLDFDGQVKDVGIEELASRRYGDDWLLFLTPT